MALNVETMIMSCYRPINVHSSNTGSFFSLPRAMSDLSFEMKREVIDNSNNSKIPPISDVEEAKCECCGMSEECTPGYIRRVRERFCGRWVCGLCSAAVKEEEERAGTGSTEEALAAHMGVCARFNRVGRKQPLLGQVEAMREILKRRSKSSSPREKTAWDAKRNGTITRSTSCIPAITKEIN